MNNFIYHLPFQSYCRTEYLQIYVSLKVVVCVTKIKLLYDQQSYHAIKTSDSSTLLMCFYNVSTNTLRYTKIFQKFKKQEVYKMLIMFHNTDAKVIKFAPFHIVLL